MFMNKVEASDVRRTIAINGNAPKYLRKIKKFKKIFSFNVLY